MVISNSYVKLPEGKPHSMKTKKMRPQILEFDIFDVFFWILSKKWAGKGILAGRK